MQCQNSTMFSRRYAVLLDLIEQQQIAHEQALKDMQCKKEVVECYKRIILQKLQLYNYNNVEHFLASYF